MNPSTFDRLTRRAALAAGGASLAGLGALGLRTRTTAQDASPAASPGASSVAGSATLAHSDADFLFVQVATDATWTPKPNTDGVYLLTLSHQDGQTLYFSDRPERIVGATPTQAFLDGLGFTPANPPNAAIVASEEILVVELTNPTYDAATGTLTYDATIIDPGSASSGIQHLANRQTDQDLPQDLGPTSLFIDSAQETCTNYTNCWLSSQSSVPGIDCTDNLTAGVGGGAYVCTPGPIPGGPIDACWDFGKFSCEACDGRSKDDLYQLCNDTYSQCAQYDEDGSCTVMLSE